MVERLLAGVCHFNHVPNLSDDCLRPLFKFNKAGEPAIGNILDFHVSLTGNVPGTTASTQFEMYFATLSFCSLFAHRATLT